MKRKTVDRLTRIVAAIVIVLLFLLLTSCKSETVFVPVETVRTEYKDKYVRDSVRLYDSVFVKVKGDTVWLEKYKYLYRDRVKTDSVFVTDSIQVPYPVTEYVEVNKLKGWQHFLVWCGGIWLTVVFGYVFYKLVRK